MIILPDIHGRTFWKEIVNKYPEEKIIFLGDYLDPYAHEGISIQDTIANFEDIILFKKNNMDRVKLLLGNHDCGYIWLDVCNVRKIVKYRKDIENLFISNFDLFDLAYQETINGIKYVFTHAGIHKKWLDSVFKDIDTTTIEFYDLLLNNWLHYNFNKGIVLENNLGIISILRSGWSRSDYGSCVWADIREWTSYYNNASENKKLNIFQIFGHTQLEEEPIISLDHNLACLDVRRPFILTEDNIIIDYEKNIKYNLIKE